MEIAFRGISKHFGPSVALDGATASFPGKVNLLLGPNGSGKTTLINCILGLARPQKGTLEVNGTRYEASSGSQWRQGTEKLRKISSLLGDRLGTPSSFTGKEFLKWTSGIVKRVADASVTDRVIAELGLSSYLDKRISKYSSGMLQKLAVASSLVSNPEVVFWDEPVSNMDANGRAQVVKLIASLADVGKKFVIISHSPEEFESAADWFGVMVQGRFVVSGSPAALADGFNEYEAFMGEPRKLASRLVEAGLSDDVRVLEHSVVFTLLDASQGKGITAEGLSNTTGCHVDQLRPTPVSIQKTYLKALGDAKKNV